jgi:hypothetical protein
MADDECKPQSKFFKAISYFISIKELLVAVAAIVTAVYTLAKPQDTKVTQKSYEILVERINVLAKETENNHDDIARLTGYLEYSNALKQPLQPIVQAEPSKIASHALRPIKRIPSIDDIAKIDGTVASTEQSEVPPLPSISPRPVSQSPPPFAQVVQSAK